MLLFGTLHLGVRSADAARSVTRVTPRRERYIFDRAGADPVRAYPAKSDQQDRAKDESGTHRIPDADTLQPVYRRLRFSSFSSRDRCVSPPVPRSLRLFSLCDRSRTWNSHQSVKERLDTFDEGDCEHGNLTYEEPRVLSSRVLARKIEGESDRCICIDWRLDEN